MCTSETELAFLLHPREGTPDLTDTPAALTAQTQRLGASHTAVAVDVERASGFRYSSRAYLLQLRREEVGTVLVDPIACPDLSELAQTLNPAQWVLHSAHQDLPSLHQLGFRPASLFDTEVAARLLGFTRFGLAPLCEQLLGVRLDKSHQAEDWSVRPLPRSWLRYAALDVELLLPLQRELAARLQSAGRSQWAEQEFAAVLAKPEAAPDPQRWRARAAKGLHTRYQLGVVRELWQLRDRLARERDLAPTRLVPDQVLTQLALNPPRNRHSLLHLTAMRKPTVRADANLWLEAIKRVSFYRDHELPQLQPPATSQPPNRPTSWRLHHPEAWVRYQRLRAAVTEAAQTIGLESQVLFPPKVLRQLAWENPSISPDQADDTLRRLGVRPWQIQFTAAAISATLSQFQGSQS